MSSENGLGRVITAMVTPFDGDGRVSLSRASRLARHLVDSGSDGILVAGTTGESPTLSDEEKLTLLEGVLDEVGDRCFVWMGTGSNDYCTTRDLTLKSEKGGAHGAMVVTPYYSKPTQAGLLAHYTSLAGETKLPIMVYNVPGRTGVNLLPETFQKIVQQRPNVVAIKEASGSPDQASEIRSLVRDLSPSPVILSGDDSMTLPYMAVGAEGVVSVASHVVGTEISNMIEAFFRGDIRQAEGIHSRLFSVFKALFTLTNPIPVKCALNALGLEVGGFRLPLLAPQAEELEVLWEALRGVGLDPEPREAG